MSLPDIKTYSGLLSVSGNLMCAVDCETTGKEPGYHEIVQLAIQPLDENFQPYEGLLPFYTELKPDYPERAEKKALQVNGMSLFQLHQYGVPQDKCQDMLVDWFQALKLNSTRRIVPLAQNWPFDYSFLTCWLGSELFGELFAPHYRDTMELSVMIADVLAIAGKHAPFKKSNLVSLCSFFGVNYNPTVHDALEDALATAKLYPLELNLLRQCLN